MKRDHKKHPLDDEINELIGKEAALHDAGLKASEKAVHDKLQRLLNLKRTKQKEPNGE